VDSHGRVFTPQNLILMRDMAARGCSAQEIADVIGSTASSVRVKCSQEKIRLKRGRGPARSPQPRPGKLEEPVEGVPIVAYLPGPVYAMLVKRATELRKRPSVFASMLLSAVATGELYKAVLDE
jgi:hypothetical protein